MCVIDVPLLLFASSNSSSFTKDVNYALANLHSYAKEANQNVSSAQMYEQEIVGQQRVLMEDDIVDDDDW